MDGSCVPKRERERIIWNKETREGKQIIYGRKDSKKKITNKMQGKRR